MIFKILSKKFIFENKGWLLKNYGNYNLGHYYDPKFYFGIIIRWINLIYWFIKMGKYKIKKGLTLWSQF